jgi:hypothetical protein
LIIFLDASLASKAQIVNLDSIVSMDIAETTLKNALKDFSNEYQIKFSYSDSRLNTEKLVAAQYDQISLNNFFQAFFTKYDINYTIIDNQIVLFPFSANQTIRIKGKVVNQLDQSPIPYTNIVLPEPGKGTSTNEDGEFELVLTKLPSEIVVSHLAHEKKLVYIYDDQEEHLIQLLPAQKELQEVSITSRGNKNAYYNLVRKAYQKLRNDQFNDKYGKAFYRQKSSRENRYTEIFEMFYDIRYSPVGIEDWAVQEGRYAFQNKEEYDIFLYNKNFTLLSRIFPLIQPNTDSYILPVSPDVKKYFDLSLHDIIKYENRYIAIIDYQPLSMIQIPAPSGQLYIDFEDFSILKFKGNFKNSDLNIVGFSDKESSWENYNLGFEISFIDDQGDDLNLDFIRIDHTFDYYFDKTYIGEIKTNSLLTFYEHYFPVRNKKLGGSIDYKTSDMELIDRAGYNPIFWKQNPIVKRTPIEEKLILDFEQNEAFGAVFMNNDDEVVLLPDQNKSKKAKDIIAKYEDQYKDHADLEIFLRLDKYNYQPGEKIHLAGYIYDKWSYRPYIRGSVLTIDLKNKDDEVLLTKRFDIIDGSAFGEIDLKEISKTGFYEIQAYTNVSTEATFSTRINVSPFSSSVKQHQLRNHMRQGRIIATEGGTLLVGVPTKIAYDFTSMPNYSPNMPWSIIDEDDEVIQTFSANDTGIGSFTLLPRFGKSYFLKNEENNQTIGLPEVVSTGMSIQVSEERTRSLRMQIGHRPALPKDIYVLSTFKGKVISIFEKKLNSYMNTIDIPIQFLKDGINELVIVDAEGEILASRKVFNRAVDISIELLSARWRSKRSNRLEIELKITNNNGKPVNPNLSVVCSQYQFNNCNHCDIRNDVLLGEQSWSSNVNFNQSGASLNTTIDNLLILDQTTKNTLSAKGTNQVHDLPLTKYNKENKIIDDEFFAEVAVSGSLYSETTDIKNSIKKDKRTSRGHETYWIPKLNIDQNGISVLDIQVPNKNMSLNIIIQGLSKEGKIVYNTLIIDPTTVKFGRKGNRK